MSQLESYEVSSVCPVCGAQIEFCDCEEQRNRPPNVLDVFMTGGKDRIARLTPRGLLAHDPKAYGRFDGYPITTWTPDGEGMILVNDYKFIDPRSRNWIARKGTRVDGASIPRPFWTLVGSPYRGKYRLASVVHDAYCVARGSGDTWEAVHFMFYQGMMAAGVEHLKAKAMYYAVYWFGPRWDANRVGRSSQSVQTDISQETVNRVARFVAKNDPSIAEIRLVRPDLLGPQ